jgi:hypothetical protein
MGNSIRRYVPVCFLAALTLSYGLAQTSTPMKGEQTTLTTKEEAAVRSSVYSGAMVSTVPAKGPWAGLPVLVVPEELTTVYKRKSEATLALLLDIAKGGSPQDARLAGGFAISLAINPFAGYETCLVSEKEFDTVIDTQEKTPRQKLVEDMKEIIKTQAEKK